MPRGKKKRKKGKTREVPVRQHTRTVPKGQTTVIRHKRNIPQTSIRSLKGTLGKTKPYPTYMKAISHKEFLFGDFDDDQVINIDDPTPFQKSKGTVEEVKLSEELQEFQKIREKDLIILDNMIAELEELKIGEVRGRVKSINSMINKLRRKRLEVEIPQGLKGIKGEKTAKAESFQTYKGVTDTIGTRIVVDNIKDLETLRKKIQNKFTVLDFENFYHNDLIGYRAYHFVIVKGNLPLEIQILSQRIEKVATHIHTAYKTRKLPIEVSEKLFGIAHKADLGDKKAIKQFKKLDLKPFAEFEELVKP